MHEISNFASVFGLFARERDIDLWKTYIYNKENTRDRQFLYRIAWVKM